MKEHQPSASHCNARKTTADLAFPDERRPSGRPAIGKTLAVSCVAVAFGAEQLRPVARMCAASCRCEQGPRQQSPREKPANHSSFKATTTLSQIHHSRLSSLRFAQTQRMPGASPGLGS